MKSKVPHPPILLEPSIHLQTDVLSLDELEELGFVYLRWGRQCLMKSWLLRSKSGEVPRDLAVSRFAWLRRARPSRRARRRRD